MMKNFEKQLSEKVLGGTASDGGKAWYAVIADVMRSVNSDRAVPELRAALIESLGYNFIQLYTNVKDNKLVTEAFWPAKISGQVKLKTKSSAGEVKGRMSVEISPGGDDLDEPTMPTSAAQADELPDVAPSRGKIKATKPQEPLGTEKSLGRKRR
jgi:hypothetical protein